MPMTAAEAYSEAQRRIRHAQTTGQPWLDLGDLKALEAIPEEIGELKELRQLGVGLYEYDEEKGKWERQEKRGNTRHQLEDISALTQTLWLRWLDLSFTELSDVSGLDGLTALQSLNLSSTPVSDVSGLGGLTALQSLNLINTPVSNVSGLGGLTALQSLNLSFTPVSDVSGLGGLTALQSLDLINTSVSNVGGLGGLTALQSLNLSFTPVSDVSGIGGLTVLQWLDIRNTKASDVSGLGGLTALQWLDLSSTPVSDVSGIGVLTALQWLNLSDTPVNDVSGLGGLTALQWLNLSDTPVNDVSGLGGLTALQTLDLSSTPVSDVSPIGGLAALQTLDLSSTPVSDVSPIGRLTALQSLDLSFTKVSDVSRIGGLTALQTLNLSSTPVSDVSGLGGLTALQWLKLSETLVNDVSPIGGQTSLQWLNLSFTPVSDVSGLGGLTALQWLDLSETQVSDVSPIGGLTVLQTLDLRNTQVSEVSSIAGLTALQWLNLRDTPVSDVSPIGGLTALQTLDLIGCVANSTWKIFNKLPSLTKLWATNIQGDGLDLDTILSCPALEALYTDLMPRVPPEVLSDYEDDNCLPRLKAWKADLDRGELADREVKVFVLGNGTAGKTQICRQLRGLGFDPQVPSTHAVQLAEVALMPHPGGGVIQGRLWDFGGQDIYHGTHALFMEGRAVFVLVWNPQVEAKGNYQEDGLALHHHSLTYWLDYVRSLAGEKAAIIVVQAQCDKESDRTTPPLPEAHGFTRPPAVVTCSAKTGEMDELRAALRSATRYLLEVHGDYRLPTSWGALRDDLRKLRKQRKTLPREEFNQRCREPHGISVPAAVLTWLHRSGEVFHREGLFQDEIVLDQEWAVRAIYAVLDRQGPCQVLQQLGGIFPASLLDGLIWKGQYTQAEQETLLGMMESCSIAFPLGNKGRNEKVAYVLPDLLRPLAEVKGRLAGFWPEGEAVQEARLAYDFLHAGILRQFLCQIGQMGGADAVYWRYGCCFYDAESRSKARVEAVMEPTEVNPGQGVIRIQTSGGQAEVLLARLLGALQQIRLGAAPRVERANATEATSPPRAPDERPLAEAVKVEPMPTDQPLVYLSYAWGGEKEAMVDRLEKRLQEAGWEVKRDKRSMRPGDWISDFMLAIGRAEKVLVVFSEKYLRSPYCMRELCYLYQSSLGEKAVFLNRIVPLVLEDAKISKTLDRLAHVRHWEQELKGLKDATAGVDPCNWGGAGEDMVTISDFCHHTEKMLRYSSDYLLPRGIADIEAGDFAAVLEALGKGR